MVFWSGNDIILVIKVTKIARLLSIFFIFIAFNAASAIAQTGLAAAKISGFTITAQNLSRDLEKNLLVLEGNVQVTYKDQHFSANYIEINMTTKQAIMRGKVLITTNEMTMGGDEIQLDYESNQAAVINGYVQSNNIRFQGRLIEQQNDKNFYVVDAEYTTCNNCPATWSFDGSQIKAELGGYAFLKSTFLKVGGVPVFWLPYLIVPLKNERQTGLLSPEFGHTDSRKFVFSQSLFWAIDRSQDITFTLKTYELGGLKELLEYRYAWSDSTFGQINVSHMQDSVFRSSYRYQYFRDIAHKDDRFNRWSIRSYQQFGLGGQDTAADKIVSSIANGNVNDDANFSGDFHEDKLRLLVNQVSDLQYPKDFFDEFKKSSADSGLENKIAYSRPTDNTLLSVEAIYFKHLLEANPLASNSAAVHKLPQIRLDTQLFRISNSPFYMKLDAKADNFYREKKYDDISILNNQKYVSNVANDPACDHVLASGQSWSQCNLTDDGLYNEGQDLLRTGHRINLRSAITTEAITLGSVVNVVPQFSLNHSSYLFPVGEKKHNHRNLARFDLLSRSKLFNIYDGDLKDGVIENKYKHELIPEIAYSWIPLIQQDAHPFFGSLSGNDQYYSDTAISDNDLMTNKATSSQTLQFDNEDGILDRHVITLTFLNRVIQKNIKDNNYRNILDFRLSQSYDFYKESQSGKYGQPLSKLTADTTLNLGEFTFINQLVYDTQLAAADSSSSLTYLNSLQQYFRIGYNSIRSGSVNQDDALLAIGFVTNYLNLLTGVIVDTSENRTSDSRLKKHSLIAQFKPPGECWAVNFFREQRIGLDAEWKVSFDFSFDGKPTKVILPEELNIKIN